MLPHRERAVVYLDRALRDRAESRDRVGEDYRLSMNQTTASRIVDAFPLHSTILRQFPQKPETAKNRFKTLCSITRPVRADFVQRSPLLRRQVTKRPGIARVIVTLLLGAPGCVQPASRPEYVEVVQNLQYAAHRPPESVRPDDPDAAALDPAPTPPDLLGPQPVDAYIRQALRENRTVQAAALQPPGVEGSHSASHRP